MNVTQNKNNGLIDITGITELEALKLLSLFANTCGATFNSTAFYTKVRALFPEYHQVWAKYYARGYDKVNISVDNETHVAIIDEVMALRQKKPAQKRDANGRFAKKVWVARFSYPDSHLSWNSVPRTVITKLADRKAPLFERYIEGLDLARNGFRRFNTYKIIGAVKWTKEYASDVKL